jgi:hypothetical protein
MTLPMKRKNIFTEEDRELSKVLNADPLGFQMIWSYFGQKIYHNKINSATFDIRNFNLNLFNHFVMYKLEESNKLPLNNNRENIEKILILLENLVVWSWYKKQTDFIETGLTGTNNAKKRWENESKNIDLASKREKLELVQSQHIYGINGRYKGSFINMDFFDSDYEYNQDKMQEVEKLLFKNDNLKALYHDVYNWVSDENRTVEKIPTKKYLDTFGKSKGDEVSKYTKEFWLGNLGFDANSAKIFYDLIDVEDREQDLRELFSEAFEKSRENRHFTNILTIEPIMAYIDMLFKYILSTHNSEGTHKVSKIPLEYFKPIIDFDFEQFKLECSDSLNHRLKSLAKIKDAKSLIDYHCDLMRQRGKLPWVEIKNDKIKVLMIKQGDDKQYEAYLDEKKDDLKSIAWIHDYYKGTVRQIKRSLES